MIISVSAGFTYLVQIGATDTTTFNVNLRDSFLFAYPNVLTAVTVVFKVAGNIGSIANTRPAVYTGIWPAGSKITLITDYVANTTGAGGADSPLNGIIAGCGGDGARYIWAPGGQNQAEGDKNGTPGGPAIVLGHDLFIVNNGIIGGGGQGTPNTDGGGNGGAGINPGPGYSTGTATFLKGQGPVSGGRRGGNLGQAGHGVNNPLQAPYIAKNNKQYSLEGSGQVFGVEATTFTIDATISANSNFYGNTPQT